MLSRIKNLFTKQSTKTSNDDDSVQTYIFVGIDDKNQLVAECNVREGQELLVAKLLFLYSHGLLTTAILTSLFQNIDNPKIIEEISNSVDVMTKDYRQSQKPKAVVDPLNVFNAGGSKEPA